MSISKQIKIKNNKLPNTPGVYLFKDKKGKSVYVGKATNLKSRVTSYFNLSFPRTRESSDRLDPRSRSGMTLGGRPIDEMLHEVRRIDYQVTDSVIEALILEANLIRKYMPAYNVKEKDDKSFLYVVVTKEKWPRVELVRGNELKMKNVKCKIFGPYTSASSIRTALDLIRKWFPWSTCKPVLHVIPAKAGIQEHIRIVDPRSRSGMTKRLNPCFYYHIGRCPGVCVGAVTRREYMKNIRNVVLMLEGKKDRVMKNLELSMKSAAKAEHFEEAEKLRRKLFALQHIRDVAVLRRDQVTDARDLVTNGGINIFGRIEGYDISNISGTSAVGSMVVFENGVPVKNEYRKFKIKTVAGINDVAMMREVLLRRFKNSNIRRWGTPDLLVIDGGWGQVNVAQEVVEEFVARPQASGGLATKIPIVGIAKGFDRKQDQPIFQKGNPELASVVENHKDLLLRVRDEAHRFAVSYHRQLRIRAFVSK